MRKIIVFRTDRIGEVLLSTVAVDALKRKYPEAAVTFATSGYSRPIVENRRDLAEILTIDVRGGASWMMEAVRLGVLLRKKRFDMALVLNPHKVLHLACFLAGIPERVGYDRKWGALLTKKMPDLKEKGEKHEIEYTKDLLEFAGIECGELSPRLPLSAEAEKNVSAMIRKEGLDSAPLVAIHPGSSNPAKIWPCERYTELASRIKTETGCNVVILGSREEKPIGEKITRGSEGASVDLTGRLDLSELAALLNRAVLFVGNDNGPMHMAAALGVKVIAIFGRNIPGASPRRWRPWGGKHIVFHENPACRPCYDPGCPYDHRCFKAVSASAVFSAVKDMLARK
ncbi:MAG: lipopolysaccharide heptosyltransferase II [Candidatus Omnitrophota bacterium]